MHVISGGPILPSHKCPHDVAVSKQWHPIPGDRTVLIWGWCSHILSGGKIYPIKHRVNQISAERRNAAVCFIAPDLKTPLKSVVSSQFAGRITHSGLTVQDFKDEMGKTGRRREGTEMNELPTTAQEAEILKLLYG